jgi:hypothetical protein
MICLIITWFYYRLIALKMLSQPSNNTIAGLPIFFKWVMLFTIVTSIISDFTQLPVLVLSNYPYYTVIYVNIWRPLTSVLVSSGLLMSLGSALIMFFIMPEIVHSLLIQEKNISTVITFCDFFLTNAITQIVYSLLWIILYVSSYDE